MIRLALRCSWVSPEVGGDTTPPRASCKRHAVRELERGHRSAPHDATKIVPNMGHCYSLKSDGIAVSGPRF